MRVAFEAIASDYDGTLADEGKVSPETLDVLRRARAAGLILILITGRRLDDLLSVFSDLPLFHLVVAENGAVIFDPLLGSEIPLCPPPAPKFLARLTECAVPFTVGRRVIATIRPHEKTVDRVIEELNLNMEVAFNRESVMVLPSGVGKASGLLAALLRLNLNPDGVVGIGDAENDEPFLRLCGVSVAVANAIESLKDQVDLVTTHEAGAGSAEIIRRIMSGKNLI